MIQMHQMIRSLKQPRSHAHDFIMDLNNGYATKISERGGNLSGGQGRELYRTNNIVQSSASHHG